MSRSNSKTEALGLVFAWLLLPGCVVQHAVSIEDHPKLKSTRLETVKAYKLGPFQWGDSYQFWLCNDEGKTLTCSPQCGDDIKCPPLVEKKK